MYFYWIHLKLYLFNKHRKFNFNILSFSFNITKYFTNNSFQMYCSEYTRYNPFIPMKIPFPGPNQCIKGQKLMLVGKILDNNQVKISNQNLIQT